MEIIVWIMGFGTIYAIWAAATYIIAKLEEIRCGIIDVESELEKLNAKK